MKPMTCPLQREPRLSRTVAGLLAGFLAVSAAEAVATPPEGAWYAEGGAAIVRIGSCGKALCGRVVWLRSPFGENGCDLRDERNPDVGLRERKVLDLEILRGLEKSPDEENVWVGGSIYDPSTGKTYRCQLTVAEDRLYLRGYVGVPLFGRTTSWIRVGAENRACRDGRRSAAP